MSLGSFDNVKVAVRVRPFVPLELERGCRQVIEKSVGDSQLLIKGESCTKPDDFYSFDNVFMMNESQENVYKTSVQPLIAKLFEGFNVTVLAYG
jgi:kinesin family protein 4/21/27